MTSESHPVRQLNATAMKPLAFLLFTALAVQLSTAYRLNVPRVLLPYYPKNQVSYILEVKEPDGGCFHWKSSRPNIVSVEALETNGGCSSKALITARSRHSTEQSAVITANDAAGQVSLSCDVRVDVIDRIEVFTTTGFLFIEGPPARITVNGFNSRGNEFSTLGSIPTWIAKSDRRPLRLVSYAESNYEVPFGIAELESQKKRGSSILVEGIQTGKASLSANIIDPDLTNVNPCSTELFVVQKAILEPSEDMYVPVGAIIDFNVRIIKKSGDEIVKLPSPQFKIIVNDTSICKWNEKTSQIVAKQVGSTQVTLIDTTFEEFSKEMFEYVRITVVQPDSIGFTVDRGDNWHFQLDLEYNIHVKLRDNEGRDLVIPTNARFATNFESDHIKTLSASKNNTYFHVRAYKTGSTHIKSTFVELIGEDGKPYPVQISGRKKIEINPPITVSPGVLVFPYDPKSQYEYRLKATGGSGLYSWTSDNKHTANVVEDGLVRSGALGEAVIRAEDFRNPLHFGLSKVLVINPDSVGFGPSQVEAEIGTELTLNVKLFGHLNEEHSSLVPFIDCRQSDLRFGVNDPRFFEIVHNRTPEIPIENRGCRTVTLRALAPGDAKLTVWFGHLTATIDISAYPPLKISTNQELLLAPGSTFPVTFEGGPRPWLLDPTRYFSNVETNKNEVAFVAQDQQQFFNVFCRESVANTSALEIERQQLTHCQAVATAEIQLCCSVPSRLALHPKSKVNRENLPACPSSSLSIHCNTPADLELRGFGYCIDGQEREFASISSLLVDYKTSQKELAKVYATDSKDGDHSKLHALVEPKGLPGRLTIRAQSSQFYSQGSKSPKHKHNLPKPVATELTLLLVNFVESYPPNVVLWNRPNAHTTVQLRGGSGHFYVDMSESGKHMNVDYNEEAIGTATKTVEIRPLHTGSFVLPIYDICIDNHRLEIPIKITELSGIEMDNAQFIELFSQVARKIKLYDIDGEAFSLEDVGLTNLQVVLAGQYFQVAKFDLADSSSTSGADDGKTLRVQLKFPGKSVFTIWEPEDERLTKVHGLPVANLTHARKVYSKRQQIEEDASYQRRPYYSEEQQVGPVSEQSCSRRYFDNLTLYKSYGFGVPEILAEFFDRNLGLFILLITVSVTISAISALIWLFNRYRPKNAPIQPVTGHYKSPNVLKYPGRNTSSFIEWTDTQKPKFYRTSTPNDLLKLLNIR
ncbi:Nuclear pore complex protein 12 [Aphelenchoides bicaudatus]|nr:Nuclear pore complex protein 12 [Aphelenchoides bicaudatus]